MQYQSIILTLLFACEDKEAQTEIEELTNRITVLEAAFVLL